MYVLSMATDFTCCSTSQSASWFSSKVVVPNTRTFGESPCGGPQTQCCVLPMSMPATSGWITGSAIGDLVVFFFLLLRPSGFVMFAFVRRLVPARGGSDLDSDLGESLLAANEQTSSMNDRHLGPKLNKGHEAPVNDGARLPGPRLAPYIADRARRFILG